MTLQPGASLGPYEIIGSVGAGGMGEVYRARDKRLGRTVALKVLPRHLAADPVSRARFDREARSIAALNHPNVCALFDVGNDGGHDFLVMELLEGVTLQDRLKRGPLELPQLIEYAIALADALEAAHSHSLIHRDLKPANVFITARGVPKILDFGLAKGTDAADDASGENETMLTTVGTTVGTLSYMSPEQLRGEQLDARTDLFSFGLVLYEMATGHRAFEGKTGAVITAGILGQNVKPPRILRPDLPVKLEETILKAVEKDRDLRTQSAADLRAALMRVRREMSGSMATTTSMPVAASGDETRTTAVAAAPASNSRTRSLAIAAMSMLAIGAVAIYLYGRNGQDRPAPPPTVQAESAPQPAPASTTTTPTSTTPATPSPEPAKLPAAPPRAAAPVAAKSVALSVPLGDTSIFFGALGFLPIAISPDGTRIVYVGTDKAHPGGALYTTGINQPAPVRLDDTAGASGPFFSPDGKWIGYALAGKIMKVPSTGGGPVAISTTDVRTNGSGTGSWGSDGRIVFDFPMFRLSAAGGVPEDLHVTGRSPQALDGGAVLFTQLNTDGTRMAAALLPDGSKKELVRNAISPRFVAPGYLAYADRSTLMALKFDPKRVEVSGTPVPLVDGVAGAAQGWAAFSVSSNGSLAYVPGTYTTQAGRTLLWTDRTGQETPWEFPLRPYSQAILSPDNSMFATVMNEGSGFPDTGRATPNPSATGPNRVLYVGDMARHTLKPMTDSLTPSFAWMPGGGRVVYTKRDGMLYWRRNDLSAPEQQIKTPAPLSVIPLSPDQLTINGPYIVWPGRDPATPNGPVGLYVLSGLDPAAPGGGTAIKIERSTAQFPPGALCYPRLSPDSKWLAFLMRNGTQANLYLRPFPGPGTNNLVAQDVLTSTIEWRGRDLIWRKAGGKGVQVMAVTVNFGQVVTMGAPRVLYDGPDADAVEYISSDGNRFSGHRSVGPVSPKQINVIVNWIEELKQRVK